MDVFGFTEALAAAETVRLSDEVETTVVSLPALALLKIFAWQDRHHRSPRKDAHDLMLVASNYLELGNAQRLWSEFLQWTEDDDFDYQRTAGRMLGHDIRQLLDEQGVDKLATILAAQSSETVPGQLPEEMSRIDTERARTLLRAILLGVRG
jgi:predicted nucleotidyltransferase